MGEQKVIKSIRIGDVLVDPFGSKNSLFHGIRVDQIVRLQPNQHSYAIRPGWTLWSINQLGDNGEIIRSATFCHKENGDYSESKDGICWYVSPDAPIVRWVGEIEAKQPQDGIV